jgi:DNA-binding transcriptional LysR family regulator
VASLFDILDDASNPDKAPLPMTDDLAGLAVFIAVAETKGFRSAGEQLGVSGSAVSQSLRALEERLGVALVHRTTRSVALTEAGKRLYERARPALDDIRGAITAATELSDAPRGKLRLHVAIAAEHFLNAQVLADFLEKHPEIQLELFLSDEPLDIVASGYDAGIRLGEVIDRDMIAVPLSGDIRLTVVGAPAYFAKYGKPQHPRDLIVHRCINWHPTESSPPYRWEFTENGRDFSVDVRARALTNQPELNLRMAIAGAGLTLADERRSRSAIARGELVEVLKDFSTPFPGFYLYYPHKRHASALLRALLDHLRSARTRARSAGKGSSATRVSPNRSSRS